MLKLTVVFLLVIVAITHVKAEGENPGGRVTVSGYVKDSGNGEALVGVNVYVKELKTGTVTNVYGFYSISVIPGNYKVVFSYLGFTSQEKTIELKSNVSINLELSPLKKELDEVVVSAERPDANVKRPEMSVNRLDNSTIKKIPALMGEVDILKAIQMLPGVLPTAEGTSGFSVRGGNMDQNLIVLDEATVYNASHLMGFFSVFNNDAIRDIALYKGDIPPMYGGRLSSVLDVRMKEGNNKKFCATGGVGLISSRLTLEGPIGGPKTSFLISGRRTYADLFFPLMSDSGARKSIMYFYDFNLKVNHQINQNNRIYLSGYLGRDKFGQKGTSDAGFGNQTATLRWNHLFSDKLFSNISAVFARYDYSLQMKMGGSDYVWKSQMLDLTLKADFNFFLNPENEIKFGASSTYHDFDPCEAYMQSEISKLSIPYPKNYALEHGLYISNQQKVGDNLIVKYGVRYSIFQNIGKGRLYHFNEEYQVTDSIEYPRGKIFHTYQGLEPRVGLNYTINERSSVKASYAYTLQYMQLASNSTGGMPLDTWFPSSPNVKPQESQQFAVGYFRNFMNNAIEASVETYYKKMDNVIDFKDHPQLLMNPRMEGEVRTGRAQAYGVEFFVKKNEGKLNGWISYTLSKVRRKVATINDGNWYPSPYDKPNTVNVILSYEFSKRHVLSANFVYATGAPITAPVAVFPYGNTINKIYSSRNGYRMRDYDRLDLSYTIKSKVKPGRSWRGEWVFSLYNAYGRHNDWMLNFTEDKKNPGTIVTERWYLPFVFFPGITYNFSF
ncbi:MAG TPA: TonB-dependent receptor [Bacteroidales bacterium]